MTAPEGLALWQAWRSPASLGLPLSVPAACGCHEIDHLKVPIYPMYRLPHLFRFVKYFLCSEISVVSFFLYPQECNNRVFIAIRITLNRQP